MKDTLCPSLYQRLPLPSTWDLQAFPKMLIAFFTIHSDSAFRIQLKFHFPFSQLLQMFIIVPDKTMET